MLHACSEKTETPVIKGVIEDGMGKTVYLRDMTIKGEKLDSTVLTLNGNFEFFINIDEPKDFLLYIDPENYLRLVILPGEKVSIFGKATDLLSTCSISGSENSIQLRNIMHQNIQANLKIDSLNLEYRLHENSPQLLSIMENLHRQALEIKRSQREYLENIILQNQYPLVSYVILSLRLGVTPIFSIINDYEIFEMVDSAVNSKYQGTTIAETLKHFVAINKARVLTHQTLEQQLSSGNIAPEIALPTPAGDTVKLSSLLGNYVLVDFWASWSKPCRLNNRELLRIFNQFRWRKFTIYQVSLDTDPEQWKNAIKADNLPWINVSDLRFWESQAAKAYNVKGIPSNFLLDAEGKIIGRDLYGTALVEKLNAQLPAVRPKPGPAQPTQN